MTSLGFSQHHLRLRAGRRAAVLGTLAVVAACRPVPAPESQASYADEETAVPSSAAAAAAANAAGLRPPSTSGQSTTISTGMGPGSRAAVSPLFADVAPVSALAFDGRSLWVGSSRGLRRVDVRARTVAWIERDAGLEDRDVRALAADGPDTVWVASGSGLGVFESDAASRTPPRYRRLGTIAGVTSILPIASTPEHGDAWLGTETGLLLFAGGMVHPIAAASGDVVTFLDSDTGGRSVWVGLRRRGLLRLDVGASAAAITPLPVPAPTTTFAVGPESAGALDFVNPIGMTHLPNGTSIAIGRARAGGTRLLVLGAGGAVLMSPQSTDLPVQAVIPGCRTIAAAGVLRASVGSGSPSAEPTCALLGNLIAGPDAAPTRFRLELATRGESAAPGSLRFAPIHRTVDSPRIIARPLGRIELDAVTAVLQQSPEDEALFVGTRSAGTASISAAGAMNVLPSGELARGATHLSLACPTERRCFIATGSPTGWDLDGPEHRLEALPATTLGGHLMALATAADGSTLSIAGDPGNLLRIGRLSADGTGFSPLAQVAVPIRGAAIATYAAVSPKGDLWVAIRDELPRGVLEIQFPSMRVVHHRPYSVRESPPPDAIPIDADVRALGFEPRTADAPQAMWFCTAHGVFRFREGTLDHWGEDNGLPSEQCHDLLVGKDRSVWAATAGGPSHFDEKGWHTPARWPTSHPTNDQDGEGLAARGLAELGGRLWVATGAGLWSTTTPAGDARTTTWQHDARLTDSDVVGLAGDRFARLWALGRSGVTRLGP